MNKKPKRKNGAGEVKILLLTSSLVATLALWNYFSQQDKQALLASQGAVTLPAEAPPAVTLDLPPVPTLLPPSGSEPVQATAPVENQEDTGLVLRSVSAPSQQTTSGSGPLVVGGSSGGGGGGGGGRTRSS